jgi:uncharacterized SAM-binding protein YcdF (DUF218 family)
MRKKTNPISALKRTVKAFRIVFVILGVFLFLLVAFSFTSLPFYAFYHLGTGFPIQNKPTYIVVMGAGGMPGAEGLMRCYYGADAARQFPDAKIIIALPTLPQYFDDSHTKKMYHEMVLRGVDSTRFLFEITGTNTRQQAANIAQMTGDGNQNCFLVITSPEHINRTVKVFRKLGMDCSGGLPSFEEALDPDLLLTSEELKSGKIPAQRMAAFRYNMWNYLKLEITVLREYIAIAWYWLNGWI